MQINTAYVNVHTLKETLDERQFGLFHCMCFYVFVAMFEFLDGFADMEPTAMAGGISQAVAGTLGQALGILSYT